jgi:hypothetical protein
MTASAILNIHRAFFESSQIRYLSPFIFRPVMVNPSRFAAVSKLMYRFLDSTTTELPLFILLSKSGIALKARVRLLRGGMGIPFSILYMMGNDLLHSGHKVIK